MSLLADAQRSPQHNALRTDVQSMHLPTQRIALEHIVRLAIEHFHVSPNRHDWNSVLEQSFLALRSRWTWTFWPPGDDAPGHHSRET